MSANSYCAAPPYAALVFQMDGESVKVMFHEHSPQAPGNLQDTAGEMYAHTSAAAWGGVCMCGREKEHRCLVGNEAGSK